MPFSATAATADQIDALKRWLDASDRKDTLGFDELSGFLFAIVSSPILVKPSEWLPEVLGRDSEFENEDEARAVMSAIMARYNTLVGKVEDGGPISPEDVGIDPSSEPSLRSWSRGFVTGFSGLHEAWQAAIELLDEEERRRFHAIVPVLLVWADPDVYRETSDIDQKQLEAFLETCRRALPAALGTLATMGVSIYRATLSRSRREASPSPSMTNAVGGNEPCPCGSGKEHERCCGLQ